MTVNYHTHTPLCHHATGEMREYIECAIKAGFKKLGFSDHSPQFYTNGFVSSIRMTPAEAYSYIANVKKLAEEYRSDIEILTGFEAEYFPEIFPKLRDFCRENGVDYLILGQHCLTKEPSDHWVSTGTKDIKLFSRYVSELIEGLSTGSFSYLCHPDVFQYNDEENEEYISEITRLFRATRELNIPVEINLLGLRGHRSYPRDIYAEIAKNEGNTFIYGVDAHEPEALLDTEGPALAEKFIIKHGITVLDDIPLRKI